jgi:pyridoxamine 5'-phosphate oxidase
MPLPPEPLTLATDWLAEAWQAATQPNPNAMVLATLGDGGQPSARVVLCKEFVAPAGYLVFHSNYDSHKGRELAAHPRAAAVFHWDALHRQLRAEGVVVKAPAAESDEYFRTRPWQSRVGAWASQQSRPIASREQLIANLEATAIRFGIPRRESLAAMLGDDQPEITLPRPPNWGGYYLWITALELWVEGEFRIHDRARWERTLTPGGGDEFTATPWQVARLQP